MQDQQLNQFIIKKMKVIVKLYSDSDKLKNESFQNNSCFGLLPRCYNLYMQFQCFSRLIVLRFIIKNYNF